MKDMTKDVVSSTAAIVLSVLVIAVFIYTLHKIRINRELLVAMWTPTLTEPNIDEEVFKVLQEAREITRQAAEDQDAAE